jgi:SAM-dependent methyltransferase
VGQSVQEVDKLAQRLGADATHKEQLGARLAEVERWAHEAATNRADLAHRMDAESASTRQLAVRLSDLGLFTHQTRANLSIQDSRLALFIEEARKHLPRPLREEDLRDMVNDHTRHRFDSLYAAFEDVFRGTREDVKSRQSVYLPLLQEHGVGSAAMPLLDLGCGRGEWLELLGEHGLKACGVDLNEAMIDRCKSFGLEVVKADALPYLGTLPDGCMGAVTAFHMVEHMPFDVVLTLVDESLRVLKPGGLLILETPNPSNLQVAALTFHLDPTHLKPLPSIMLRFFVEGRGFCDVHVRELHPYPEVLRFADHGNGLANRLNDYFYGPQDYAVIGRRP